MTEKRRSRELNLHIGDVLSETDANNPYGPNYRFLSRPTKAYYKYLRLSKFVHVEEQDQVSLLDFNYVFYAGIGLATLSGFLASNYFGRAALRRFPSLLPAGTRHMVLINGIGASFFGATAYFKLNDYFIDNYVEPLTAKYLEEAKGRGFVDYQISADARG